MDNSLILELVFGCSCFADKLAIMNNEEYNKNVDKIYTFCESLCKDMPDEIKRKTLDEIFFAQGCAESVITQEYFKKGFKLGLILGAQNFLDL